MDLLMSRRLSKTDSEEEISNSHLHIGWPQRDTLDRFKAFPKSLRLSGFWCHGWLGAWWWFWSPWPHSIVNHPIWDISSELFSGLLNLEPEKAFKRLASGCLLPIDTNGVGRPRDDGDEVQPIAQQSWWLTWTYPGPSVNGLEMTWWGSVGDGLRSKVWWWSRQWRS